MGVEIECRNCQATYDLASKPGSRYYCPRCMSREPYGFAKSKLLGQMVRQLTLLEQQRAKVRSEIDGILALAKKKEFRPRDLERLRGLCWVNDPDRRDTYLAELTKIRTDVPDKPTTLPGMGPVEETPTPVLPGMVEAKINLPGM